MGKASSTKKVARAARAGGNRGAGQRRNLGFPATIVGVILLGLLLIVVTRQDRISNAAPRAGTAAAEGDHWHVPYSVYTCVPDPSTPVTPPPTTAPDTTVPDTTAPTTTLAPASGTGLGAGPAHLGVAQTDTTTTTPATPDSSTTTVPDSSTTVPAVSGVSTTTTLVAEAGDVPGVFQAPFQDAGSDANGIHTHGDGVIHVHPFNSAAAGRNAQLKVFLQQVGVTLTDSQLSFTDPSTGELLTYKEGTTKCEGGKDGIVQVGLWDKLDDAANGLPPNQVVTSNVAGVRLKNGHALTIAFLPKDSRIPIESDVKHRYENLTDVTTTTTAPASTESSGATTTVPAATGSSDATTTTVAASSSSSSGG